MGAGATVSHIARLVRAMCAPATFRARNGGLKSAAALAGALATAFVAALVCTACSRAGNAAAPMDSTAARTSAPSPSTLDRLVAQCAEDMVRQTCRIMGNATSAAVPDDTVIFVAGIGAIDAAVYNRLRADGEGMCETVRRSCELSWSGPSCRTARALYGGE